MDKLEALDQLFEDHHCSNCHFNPCGHEGLPCKEWKKKFSMNVTWNLDGFEALLEQQHSFSAEEELIKLAGEEMKRSLDWTPPKKQ